MTFKQFTIFASAAKHLNITRAARELHISQPSASQQLKLLEDNYKAKFYKRSGRGIELTEAGWVFLNRINPILDQLGKLRAAFGAAPTASAESLIVGGTYNSSALLLPLLLAVFKRKHPQVQVTLRTKNMRIMEKAVLDSEVEIAVVSRPSASPDLVVEPYRRERLVAFVAKSHPLARKNKFSFHDTLQVPLVIRVVRGGKSSTELILKQFEEQGFGFNIAMRCESPEAVKVAVKGNAGVGILYEDVVGPDLRRGDFKEINLPGLKLEGRSFIIYRRDSPLSASAGDFLTLLHRWRRKNPGPKRPLSHRPAHFATSSLQ